MKRLARAPMLNTLMGKKRLTPTAIFWLLLLTVSSVFTTKTYAQPLVLDGKPDQWANAQNTGLLQNFPNTVKVKFTVDSFNSANDNVFTGTAEKDDVPAYKWTTSTANDKNDIRNTALVLITPQSGGHFLYFMADRYSDDGDAGIGIWIYKNPVDTNLVAKPGSAFGFDGVHTDGDLYIVSHFTGGGGTSDRHLYVWDHTFNDNNTGHLREITLSLAAFQNAVLADTVPVPTYPNWFYNTKSNKFPGSTYPPNTFFEGYLNLDSIPGANACFTSTLFMSSQSQNVNESAEDLVLNGFSTKPEPPAATSDSSCGPKLMVFTAQDTGAFCDRLIWYSDAALTDSVGNGSPFDTTLQATTKFYVVCSTNAGCKSAPDSVTGTVFPVPDAPPATNDSSCGPKRMHFTATGGANCDKLIWSSNAGFTDTVAQGATFDTTLSATTKFYVKCVSSHGCAGKSDSVTGTVFPVPDAPPATNDSSCGPDKLTFTATSGENCSRLVWYSDAGLTDSVAAGSPFDTTLNATTKFYVICVSTHGCKGKPDSVTGTIFPVPDAPAATSDSACGTTKLHFTANSNGANCDRLVWYSDAGLTDSVAAGSPFDTTLNATTKFYVVCVSTHGCKSLPDSVTGTIFPGPATPTTTNDSACGTTRLHFTASGSEDCNRLVWYSDAGLNDSVAAGSPFDTTLSATTKFYVVCVSSHGCVSKPDSVTGTIFHVPDAPPATDDSSCGPKRLHFTANSSGADCDRLVWYSNAGLTDSVAAGSPFDTTLNATTKFYVICVSNHGCKSLPDSVTGKIKTVPTVTFNGFTACASTLVHLINLVTPTTGVFTTRAGAAIDSLFQTSTLGDTVIRYTVTQDGCSAFKDATITIQACNNLICTRTQGFFGGGGKLCDGTGVIALLNQLLTTSLTVGLPAPYNSVTVPAGAGQRLHDIMPGSSTPRALALVGNVTIFDSKFIDSFLVTATKVKGKTVLDTGRINNVLLSQTITLKLGTRMSPSLLAVPLAGTIYAQQATGCGQTAAPKACPGTINQFTVTASVVNYLGATATVADLLNLADSLLAGALKPGQVVNGKTVPSYADVNNAIDAFNNGFDQCRFLVSSPCPPVRMAQQSGSGIAMGSFTVYPNPSGGTFTIESEDINTNLDHTQVTITDVTGKVMNTVNSVNGAKMQVTLQNAAPGIYLIVITDANGTYRSKILIQ